MTPTGSPIAQVFNTAELLEAVLGNLPSTSLLHAQEVCGQWQAVIRRSNTLQRSLYLKADASERVEQIGKFTETCHWALESEPKQRLIGKPTLNPYLEYFLPDHGTWAGLYSCNVCPPIFTAPGSWRRMYLCSPPVAYATLEFTYFFDCNVGTTPHPPSEACRVEMTDGIGVRLGDVVDAVRAEFEVMGAYTISVELDYDFQ